MRPSEQLQVSEPLTHTTLTVLYADAAAGIAICSLQYLYCSISVDRNVATRRDEKYINYTALKNITLRKRVVVVGLQEF